MKEIHFKMFEIVQCNTYKYVYRLLCFMLGLVNLYLRWTQKFVYMNYREKCKMESASHPDGAGMKLHGIDYDGEVSANARFSWEEDVKAGGLYMQTEVTVNLGTDKPNLS